MKRTDEVEDLVLPCPKENHILEDSRSSYSTSLLYSTIKRYAMLCSKYDGVSFAAIQDNTSLLPRDPASRRNGSQCNIHRLQQLFSILKAYTEPNQCLLNPILRRPLQLCEMCKQSVWARQSEVRAETWSLFRVEIVVEGNHIFVCVECGREESSIAAVRCPAVVVEAAGRDDFRVVYVFDYEIVSFVFDWIGGEIAYFEDEPAIARRVLRHSCLSSQSCPHSPCCCVLRRWRPLAILGLQILSAMSSSITDSILNLGSGSHCHP